MCARAKRARPGLSHPLSVFLLFAHPTLFTAESKANIFIWEASEENFTSRGASLTVLVEEDGRLYEEEDQAVEEGGEEGRHQQVGRHPLSLQGHPLTCYTKDTMH